MRTKRARISLATLAIATSTTGSALAAELPDVFLQHLQQGARFDPYVAAIMAGARQADGKADGLDRDDIALHRALAAAEARARSIGAVLRQDLNGDLKVTRAEIERASQRFAHDEDDQRRTARIDQHLGQYDANGDGTITIAEAIAATREPVSRDDLDALLALDPDGDGRLTAKELRSLAGQAFAQIDSNGDETISREEYAPYAARIREAQMLRRASQSARTAASAAFPYGD